MPTANPTATAATPSPTDRADVWVKVKTDKYDQYPRGDVFATSIGYLTFYVPNCFSPCGLGAAYSTDGLAWHSTGMPGNPYAHDITAVTEFAGELIATGRSGSHSCYPWGGCNSASGVVWRSIGLHGWQPVDTWNFDAGPIFHSDILGGLMGVAATDDRLLAVGERLSGNGEESPSSDIELWTSTDGGNWTQVNDPNNPPTNKSGLQDAILVGGSQFVVADHWDSANGLSPVVSVSADTREWSLIGIGEPASRSPSSLQQIIRYAGGYVAFGGVSGSDQTLVWNSSDGMTWYEGSGLPESPFRWHAAVAGGQIVAVSAAGIYLSNDGLNWSRASAALPVEQVTSLPIDPIRSVVSDGSSVLLVEGLTGQIWRANAAALR